MTNVRRSVLQAALAWIATFSLVGCADEIAPSAPSAGPAPDILDENSPFAAPAQPAVAACSEADHSAAVAVWTKLRKTDYPYHLQTVALSPPFASGCRALIVAEPPPSVSLSALREVAPRLMASAETRQHEVGYDGWTRDVVVTLPPVQDAELGELIADLHAAMFETTYRMEPLDTSKPVPVYNPATTPLDIGIGPGELHRWLVEQPSQFTPLGGGDAASLKDLLASDEPDVYVDDADGLVAWLVPRRADIADMAGLFRQFTIESDLIVGAMASRNAVAIIARQRAVDPRILQPLRFETVSLLAAVHDKASLQQSYDRTNPLAGRIDDTRDWAPIFLSPELLDTEYGSVLDIADQFLKSWSNNGKTRYINFAYPGPRRWAFPAPVFVVAKADTFRYNWNTANVGAVVNVDDIDVFWLRRTGALNVSYFPNEDELAEHKPDKPSKVKDLEETAYQFFVKTQTPILARVVQYNALYQIFARFGLASSMKVPTATREAAAQVLVEAARDALTEIRNANDHVIEQRLAGFLRQQTKYLQKQMLDRLMKAQLIDEIPPDELATVAELRRENAKYASGIASSIAARVRDGVIADVKVLALTLARLDADGLDQLAQIVGDSRGVTQVRSDLFEIYKSIRGLRHLFPLFVRPDVYKRFAEHAGDKSQGWIHTPSVVISWNEPPIDSAIGGHDLTAKVSALKFHPEEPEIAAGQIARKVQVDAVGSRELPRLELGPSGPRLARAPVNREARSALGNARQHGFWREPAPRQPVTGGGTHEASVTRLSDGYRVVDAAGREHEVTTMHEVVELLRNRHRGKGKGGQITVRFDGLGPDEIRRVQHSAEIRGQAEVAGVVKPMPEFAKRSVDVSRAVLRDTQTRIYRDGAAEIGHRIHIPDLGKSTAIDVKVAIKSAPRGVLRTLAAKIRDVIQSVIAKFRGRSASAYDVGLELRTELRQMLRSELPGQLGRDISDAELRDVLRLEIRMQQEASDITIVQREPPASHGTDDLGG
ncbi:MAG TPA: hypothetical protein VIX73_31830 [Kofleriaceae bacterium]